MVILAISFSLSLANFPRLYSLRACDGPVLVGKRITLLIAHPDDEAMFFGPTLLALAPHNTVRVLCLSTGDADGLGAVRTHELTASCLTLGVASENVVVINDARLPDSMTASWPAGVVAEQLRVHAGDAELVITFDAGGVSGHGNHVSLLHGAREFVSRLPGAPPALRTLTTVGVARKYASVLDAAVTLWARGRRDWVFVSSAAGMRVAQRAMTQAHKSQMRWFRWGWIGFSRYMVVNDLREDMA